MRPAQAKRILQGNFPAAQAEEYISEAEHQDGRGYWKNFATAAELMADFRLYFSEKLRGQNRYQIAATHPISLETSTEEVQASTITEAIQASKAYGFGFRITSARLLPAPASIPPAIAEAPSFESQIQPLLPSHWGICEASELSQESEGYRFLITECDEPTFFIDPAPTLGIKWVRDFDSILEDVSQSLDEESTKEWRDEAEATFARLAEFLKTLPA
jgi:hypothetical protein